MGISKFPIANNGTKVKTGNMISQSSSLKATFTKNSNVKNLKISSSILKNGLFPGVKKALEGLGAAKADVSAFESLTNLSSQRPEIIALTPFQPLYNDSGDLTPSGKLFDTLVEYMRSLDKTSQNAFGSLDKVIEAQNNKLESEVTRIRDTLKTFYDVYRSLADTRKALTITNEYYDFNPTKLVNKIIREDSDVDKSAILAYASKLAEELNVKNTLKLLRYKDSYIDEFSPTVAFVNLANETVRILTTHSYNLSKDIKRSPPTNKFFGGEPLAFPERSFYSYEDDRVSLLNFGSTGGTGNALANREANFASINDFTLSETQQSITDSYRKGEKAAGEGNQFNGEAYAASLENEYKTTNNYDNLVETYEITNSEFSRNDKKILGKLTFQGSIAATFLLISREIRMSKKWNAEKMGAFPVDSTVPNSFGILRSIFGHLNQNLDLYQDVNMNKSSIMELAQLPVNSNNKVLLFEQTPGQAWGKKILAGGDYYFDPELLINFAGVGKLAAVKTTKNPDGTFNVSSNGASVAIRSRIETMASRLEATTTDFFKCATEMGLLVTKDEKVFDKEKPIFASTNPEVYFDSVVSAITSNIKASTKKAGFKNTELAVKAIFSFIGSGDEKATGLLSRIYILLMSEVYEQDIENTSNISKLLMRGFNGLFPAGSINNSLKKKIIDIAKGIILALANAEGALDDDINADFENSENNSSSSTSLSNDLLNGVSLQLVPGEDATRVVKSDPMNKDEFGDRILRSYQSAGVTPCVFDSSSKLLSSVREDNLFKVIVSLLKDLKNTLETYAIAGLDANNVGASKTLYNQASINSIMSLFFWAICKIINKISPYELAWSSRDTFLGLPSSQFDIDIEEQEGEGGVDGIIFGYLKDIGIIGSGGDGTSELTLFIKKKNSSDSPYQISEGKAAIVQEMQIETAALLTMLNTLQTLNKNIQSTEELFSKLEAADYANLISYLGDPNKITFLLKEPQLALAMSNIEDIYQSYQSFSKDVDISPNDSKMFFTTYYDKLSHSEKMVLTLKKFLNSTEFRSSKGYNKKIMSIGLSQDLLKNTLPKYDFEKQNDIFKLSIYKIDNLNSDVIYKPKSWLFEASRYPSRVYSDYKHDVNSLQSIPTRNYSLTYDARLIDQGESAYWSDISNSFNDEYSFLSQEEKEEIIENQAMSILMENYIRIVTGLIINESAFNLSSDEVNALLSELEFQTNAEQLNNPAITLAQNKEASEKVNNVLNSSMWSKPKPKSSGGSSGKVVKAGGSIVKSLSSAVIKNTLKNVIVRLIAIEPNLMLRYIIQPKKFDRVFNVIFDPEFEIDVEKTNSTTLGRNSLKRLVDEGDIVLRFQNPSDITSSTKPIYVDRDKEFHDMSVESFFVVLESHGLEKKLKYDENMLKKIPINMLPKVLGSVSIPSGVGARKSILSNFASSEKSMSLDIGNLSKKFKG